MTLLDRLLDGFLLGNTPWCLSVLAGVSSLHASTAKGGDVILMSPPAGDPPFRTATDERQQKDCGAVGSGDYSVGGVAAMSSVVSKGLLALDPAANGSFDRGGGKRGSALNPGGTRVHTRCVERVERAV